MDGAARPVAAARPTRQCSERTVPRSPPGAERHQRAEPRARGQARPRLARVGEGRRETEEEALIRALIEQRVAPTPPDEAAMRAA